MYLVEIAMGPTHMTVRVVMVGRGIVPMFVVIAVVVEEVVVVLRVVVVVVGFPQDVLQEVADVVVVEVVHQIAFAEWMSLVSVDRHVVLPMILPVAEAVPLPVGRHIAAKGTAVGEVVRVLTTTGVMELARMEVLAGPEPIPAPIRQV